MSARKYLDEVQARADRLERAARDAKEWFDRNGPGLNDLDAAAHVHLQLIGALTEHEARKGAGPAPGMSAGGSMPPRVASTAQAGSAKEAEWSADPLAAIPKIIASLRLSPDPETRADAERLAIALGLEGGERG